MAVIDLARRPDVPQDDGGGAPVSQPEPAAREWTWEALQHAGWKMWEAEGNFYAYRPDKGWTMPRSSQRQRAVQHALDFANALRAALTPVIVPQPPPVAREWTWDALERAGWHLWLPTHLSEWVLLPPGMRSERRFQITLFQVGTLAQAQDAAAVVANALRAVRT